MFNNIGMCFARLIAKLIAKVAPPQAKDDESGLSVAELLAKLMAEFDQNQAKQDERADGREEDVAKRAAKQDEQAKQITNSLASLETRVAQTQDDLQVVANMQN